MADVNTIYNEAERLRDDGKYDEAIARLNELLAIDESHVLSHLALAVIYGRVHRHEEAVAHGRRACELDPTDAFNFTAMSVTYQRAWASTQNREYISLAEQAMERARMIQGGMH